MGQFLSVEKEAIVGSVNLASNYRVFIRIYMDKQGAVALKRTWGPLIFISNLSSYDANNQ